MSKSLSTFLLIWALVGSAQAAAQDDPGETPANPDAAQPAESTEPLESEEATQDEAFLTDTEKAEIEAPEEEKNIGLAEDPDTPFFSVGGRFRWIMVPEWFIKMFGVDAIRAEKYESSLPLVSSVGAGAEFTYRKDGFDITAAVWYINLGWDDPISFKGSGESGDSWEVIRNDLQGILITADFLWSTSITEWFAIIYGAGIGLGIPFGDIIRTEATEASGGVEECACDPSETGCGETDDWCNDDEEYNQVYDIPTGIIPWINFLTGVRFKPHRHVAIYVDGGFGLGFQLGVRAGYIF